jgi:hypothetical protein
VIRGGGRTERIGQASRVGLTDRRKSIVRVAPRPKVIPWGEPTRFVGLTGATRCYPVGRTG